METVLGRGYSINDESALTDFYSPPSSVLDEDDDLFYPEEEEEEEEQDGDVELINNHNNNNNNNTNNLSSSLIDENNETNFKVWVKPLPLKLMSIETTPPPTPLVPRRLLDPINSTTTAFQNMTINTNLPLNSSRNIDMTNTNWSLNSSPINSLFPCVTNNNSNITTNMLTPTSMDRYLLEHRRLSDSISKSSTTVSTTTNRRQSISVQRTEVTNETSRLLPSISSMDGLSSNVRTTCATSSNSWSNFDDTHSVPTQIHMNNNSYVPSQVNMKSLPCLNNSLFSQRINSFIPINHSTSYQQQDSWVLSEMSTVLHQNTNISLSTTAQQILAGNSTANNNRPLRSEKIDIEVIKHLIQEANWKRQCGMKKEVCVFCRNNGENELIYSSHSLKDSLGNVTCPILRAYQCPICGATGSQAHTIKYCQATGDDNNRHLPTPYEKMLCMQTFGFNDNITPSIQTLFNQIESPSSFYSHGWSDSYL